MIILGLSAFYHDAAVAIVEDGRVVAAAQQERFSRERFDPALPMLAYRACLEQAGVGPGDVDVIAYYEDPVAKSERQAWMVGTEPGREITGVDPARPEREVRERLGLDAPFTTVEHHEAHAASAFLTSGLPEAALLTADAVGEWATTAYGHGADGEVRLLEREPFPHSYGLLYSTLTGFLGFGVNQDEYKVMGLAAYGRPEHLSALRSLVDDSRAGRFRLNPEYFSFGGSSSMYTSAMADLLGIRPRAPGSDLRPVHANLAASVQALLEELLLDAARHLHDLVPLDDVCYAGGVALNSVANGVLRREGPFRRWYVPPAPGDAGGAVGAALLVHRRIAGTAAGSAAPTARLGCGVDDGRVRAVLDAERVRYDDYGARTGALHDEVAARLAVGAIAGWARGRMEFGPRALGARSILADPRDAAVRDRVNALVKKREEFRPFAPAAPEECADTWFRVGQPSPYMTETVAVRDPEAVPAVTHVDGSARLQTVTATSDPDFHGLLHAFGRKSGIPVLLNTSLNVRGDPIAADGLDALAVFVLADLDLMVIGDLLVERRDLPEDWVTLLRAAHALHPPEAVPNAYTFFG